MESPQNIKKQTKNPSVSDRFFEVDPVGLAPASSDAKAEMLLYAPRARVHK